MNQTAHGEPEEDSPLNVVMIISDDHGWRDSSCYGNPDVHTPHMDQLTEEGMRFTHAFAASTLCSPSRAVIDTGQMPFRNGGHVFGGHVRRDIKTIAHYFQDLGYETANIGKFSKHPYKAFPYEYVRKRWSPQKHDEGLIDLVDEFLKQRDTDRPLFMEINTADTHQPWLENEDFDISTLTVPSHLLDTKETRDALAEYYTSVETLDANIGKFVNSLEENGYRDNTLLIYTSDHGPNFAFAKWCLYDEGIRVPFIARYPGVIEPNTATDAMISLADIVPTVIEAADGTAPSDIDGLSFLGVLTGEKSEHRDAVFASHTGNHNSYPIWKANWSPTRTIRTRTHQYILNLNPNYEFICHITGCKADLQPEAYHPYWDSWVELAEIDDLAKLRVDLFQHRSQHELYDLTVDPFEKTNIADHPENAELLELLQTQLSDWRTRQGDDVPVYLEEEYVAPNSN
jgi:N-sulfoglucosamine sulfohydrolase